MLATTIQHSNTTPHHQSRATTEQKPVASKPNSVSDDLLADPPHRMVHVAGTFVVAPSPAPLQHSDSSRLTPPNVECFVVLLRKEVIQPHLPVRLPCYDFVPIADPTFDHSLPCGLGHGLRVLPTFMT
jgi:hypothetical protein